MKSGTDLHNLIIPDIGYIFISVMGFLVYKNYFKNVKAKTFVKLGGTSAALTIAIQLFALEYREMYFVWYNNAFLVTTSFCIFVIISRIKLNYGINIITNISKNSFGIYLLHFPVFYIIRRYIECNHLLKFSLLFIATLFISWGIVEVLSKNIYLKKYLLNMK